MQTSWFKLFGKNLRIKVAPYISDKKHYDLTQDTNTIIIYSKNIAKIDTNIQYVYQDLFFKIIQPIIFKIIKDKVPKSGLNIIDFKRDQKAPLVVKYYDKQKNISNVETQEKCKLCNSNMILRVSKQKGTRFLGCSNFPKCKNTIFFDVKSNEKSKNGWYMYGSPFLLTFNKDIIESKIIFGLIQTYIPYDTYDFYVELFNLCPNYFVLNGLAADQELKKTIANILRQKETIDNSISNKLISVMFPEMEGENV